MKKINISTVTFPDTYVLVDDEDYDEVMQFNWCATRDSHTNKLRARRNFRLSGKVVKKSVQGFLLKASSSQRVTCIDGNALNCQRSNLKLGRRMSAYIINIGDKVANEAFHTELSIIEDTTMKEFDIKVQTLINKYSI